MHWTLSNCYTCCSVAVWYNDSVSSTIKNHIACFHVVTNKTVLNERLWHSKLDLSVIMWTQPIWSTLSSVVDYWRVIGDAFVAIRNTCVHLCSVFSIHRKCILCEWYFTVVVFWIIYIILFNLLPDTGQVWNAVFDQRVFWHW